MYLLIEVEVIVYDISYGLCVCRRSRPTAVNIVCDFGQFVCDSICNVGPASNLRYSKNPKNSDTRKITVITLKFEQDGFTVETVE